MLYSSSHYEYFSAMSLSSPVPSPYKAYIELEERIYNSGDVVRGELVLEFMKKMPCTEVVMKFMGDVRVFWIDEVITTSALRQRQAYVQRKSLFNEEIILWKSKLIDTGRKESTTMDDIVRFASPNSIRPKKLQANEGADGEFRGIEGGVHRFPFQCRLPHEGLYSSFEIDNDLAHVRYQFEVSFLLNGFIQKKLSHVFPVVAAKDLSEDMDKLSVPVERTEFFAYKGKLTATLTLPKTGYTPGEPLKARVIVHNNTTASVKYASVNIVRTTSCIASEPMISTKDHVFETGGSILPYRKIERGETKEWEAEIHVPALTPSLSIDDFLHVQYTVKLAVGFERGSAKRSVIHVIIPIVLGTVSIDSSNHIPSALPPKYSEKTPLEDDDSSINMQLRNRMESLNVFPPPSPLSSPLSSPRSPSPPPSYEESLAPSQISYPLNDLQQWR